MNRLLSFATAIATVLTNVTVANAYKSSCSLKPLRECILASNESTQFSKRKLKPYASFPELWPAKSAKYGNRLDRPRRLEESKWANEVFKEVSKRFKLYKPTYKIQQANLSCRVLYRVKSDKNIEVAFTKRSDDLQFDSFLNGIFKSLKGASILAFPEYIEKFEKKEKRECLAVSFEYNICLSSSGELEMGPIQFYDNRPAKSKPKRSRLMLIIDDRMGSYDSMRVRYYFNEKGV